MGYDIHTVIKQKSVGASAVTLGSDFSFLKANTKGLIVVLEALDNGGSHTLANLLTQLGSIVTVSTDVYGLITNYQTVADLYYDLWAKNGTPPRLTHHTTDNDIIKLSLVLWFGRYDHNDEGLPACQITMGWTVPADGNAIDTRKISVYQITSDHSFSKLLKQEYFPHTPATAGSKLKLSIEPRNKQILDVFLFQTTAPDDTTTDLTTIEALEPYIDSGSGIFEAQPADVLVEVYLAFRRACQAHSAYVVDSYILGNYVSVDFELMFNKPFVPSEQGVINEAGLNIIGGDTNAVRAYQRSLIPT